MELKITIEAEGIEPVIVKVDVPVEYARLFDSGCAGWSKNHGLNMAFLNMQQCYANERLRSRGVLSVNEVYDMLGLPRTACDVTYYVDFNIRSARDSEAIKGNKDSVILDFNVRDDILKYL